ncbi:hypothetical protein [Enterococcus plantarum]|nr:hypothetical protein [Enterococcus plantarum]
MHDEVVAEVPKVGSTVEEMNEIMTVVPQWAKKHSLEEEGFEKD